MKKRYHVILSKEEYEIIRGLLLKENISYEPSEYNNKEAYLNMSLDSEEVMKVNIILDWLNCRK